MFSLYDKLIIRPTQLADLGLWLDSDDAATIESSVGAVSEWDDKGGEGNNLLQGTEANQPTSGSATQNGKNVIAFNGSTDYMQNDAFASIAESPHTLFFVVTPGNNALIKTVIAWQTFGDTPNTEQTRFQFNASEQLIYHDGEGSDIVDSTSFANTALIVSATHSSTTVTTRINGATPDTNPTIADALPTGLQTFTIGQDFDGISPGTPSDLFLGDMAEILVYERVLSVSEIERVEFYLSNRWGIALG